MAEELNAGTKLMWFKIESVLGRGGFGITYLATDENLHTQVAIKEYLPGEISTRILDSQVVPRDEDDRKVYEWGLSRFLDEARILAQFKHPNIVRVLTVFEANNTAYMVMEYEHGNDLSSLIRDSRYRTEAYLRPLFMQMLSGLGEVHKKNIIHRDIKPANIFIRKDGSPVLLDFGSARQAVSGQSKNLTRVLTKGYAPYEQIDEHGGEQGPWTDIYSIGATLYYIIGGSLPIDSFSRFTHVVRKKPDPLNSVTQVVDPKEYSAEFLFAIDQALSFNAKDRPATVAEFLALLRGSEEQADDKTVLATSLDKPVSQPPPPPEKVKPNPPEPANRAKKGKAREDAETRPMMPDPVSTSTRQPSPDRQKKNRQKPQATATEGGAGKSTLWLSAAIVLLLLGAGVITWDLLYPQQKMLSFDSGLQQMDGKDSLTTNVTSNTDTRNNIPMVTTDKISRQSGEQDIAREIAAREAEQQRQAKEKELERQQAMLEIEERKKQEEAANKLKKEKERQAAELKAKQLEETRRREREAQQREQQRLARIEREKAEKAAEAARRAKAEEERLVLLENQRGKSGVDVMSERIKEFVSLFESLDVNALRDVSQVSAKSSSILDGISTRYVSGKLSISRVSVSESRGTAVAQAKIDRVVRESGESVIPGSSWNTFELKMNREQGVWGKLQW